MKKNLSKVYMGIAIMLLVIFILNSSVVIKTTEVFIPDVDKILLSNNYKEIKDTNIFEKNALISLDDQNVLESKVFDLEYDYFQVSTNDKVKKEWLEYTMIFYIYSDNRYVITYYRKSEDGLTRREYLYTPDKRNEIELIVSEFDEDNCAKTDSEKKIYFEKVKAIFNEELLDMELKTEDLINWNEIN